MVPVKLAFLDDDEVARMFLARLVRELPCKLTSYACPIICLESMATNTPELLIVDSEMPRMNGIQFLEQFTLISGSQDCQMHLCSSIVSTPSITQRAQAIGVSTTIKDLVLSRPWLVRAIEQIQTHNPE